MAFNFRQKRKGLFGSQGGWTPPIRAEQPDMGEMLPGMGMQQPEQRKPGLGTRLLGEGWEDKAFALGGLMQGDPRGAYMLQQRQDAAAQQAAQMAAEQRKRSLDMADWQAKEQWKRDNPMPVNNDTVNDVNWWMQASPEEREAYHAMNPMYERGPDGRYYPMRPQGSPPARPVGKLTPIDGGPTPAASGGFRPGR